MAIRSRSNLNMLRKRFKAETFLGKYFQGESADIVRSDEAYMARLIMENDERKRIRKVVNEAIRRARKGGVDFREGPCTCGHSRNEHSYRPTLGGSIACTICSCNHYSEKD